MCPPIAILPGIYIFSTTEDFSQPALYGGKEERKNVHFLFSFGFPLFPVFSIAIYCFPVKFFFSEFWSISRQRDSSDTLILFLTEI
jgi:hypothetical protein